MEYNSESVRNLFEYIERVNKKRGELINETINLENIINGLLASHFCNDESKRKELLTLIICKRLSLAVKTKLLKEIVSKHYQYFTKRYPSFFTHVVQINELRDRLAHMSLPVKLESGENLKKKVIEFSTHESEVYTITEDEIDQAINTAKHYSLWMRLGALAHSSA